MELKRGCTDKEAVSKLKAELTQLGYSFSDEGENKGVFGPKVEAAVKDFQTKNSLTADGWVGPITRAALNKALDVKGEPIEPVNPGERVIPNLWKPLVINGVNVHPIFNVPAPYTHLHPIDFMRAVAGEKEIYGSKDNVLIAHFHEHSPNLASAETGGSGDAKNHYHDEVPHCMSAQNWAQDGCGCYKSDTALASSGEKYAKKYGSRAYKPGDTIPEGALICIDGHITRANKIFVWNKDKSGSFEGFGSNQGNTIKTSIYPQKRIRTICDDMPKPGTVLAPIGILGHKPVPVKGDGNESTR